MMLRQKTMPQSLRCGACGSTIQRESKTFGPFTDVERFLRDHEGIDVRGPYDIEDVGLETDTDRGTRRIHVRVDYCAKCGEPLDARTYGR